MILHSGRPLPDDESPMVQNEGVGIVFDREMTAAWREVLWSCNDGVHFRSV